MLLVGVEIGGPSLLAMQPSRDRGLTWAKILKALTAVLRPPLGTNSLALRTAVRLTQARRRRRKFPQIRAGGCEGGHGLASLNGGSPEMRESEAAGVCASPAPGRPSGPPRSVAAHFGGRRGDGRGERKDADILVENPFTSFPSQCFIYLFCF